MFDGFIIICLLGLLAYQQWLHHRQIAELTLKIKAGSVMEYVEAKRLEEAKPFPDVPEDPLIPLEDIDPDRALRMIEDDLNRPKELSE